MNKDNEAWYWDNVNAAIALTLIGACERVTVKDKGVNNDRK